MARLTAARVKQLSDPGIYGDGGGLYLRIAPGGAKGWIVRIQVKGKRTDRGLGGFPKVSLAQARLRAEEMRVALRKEGIETKPKVTPLGAARARSVAVPALTFNGIPTFERVARAFHAMNTAARGWTSRKNADAWLQRATRYLFPAVGSTPIDEVTVTELRDGILIPVSLEKQETAKRLRIIARQVFEYGIESGFTTGNPIDRIPAKRLLKPSPTPQRAIPYQDVPRAVEHLTRLRFPSEGLPWPVTLQALKFLVLTAARSGEVRGATWDEIDLEGKTWTIPAERMKMARPHRVPLSFQAHWVLAQARDELGGGAGVIFPHPGSGKPLSENVFNDRLTKDAIPSTAHGFRSSFRTWAAECSTVSYESAEMSLAHTVGSATERAYLRTDLLDERRPLMQAWADYVDPIDAPF